MKSFEEYIQHMADNSEMDKETIERKVNHLCNEYRFSTGDAIKLIAKQYGIGLNIFDPLSDEWKLFHFCSSCENKSLNCWVDCGWIPSDFKPVLPKETYDRKDKNWKIIHNSNFCPYYDYAEGSNDGCCYNGQDRPMMCDEDLCPIKVKEGGD